MFLKLVYDSGREELVRNVTNVELQLDKNIARIYHSNNIFETELTSIHEMHWDKEALKVPIRPVGEAKTQASEATNIK